jgi:hypothetical protein
LPSKPQVDAGSVAHMLRVSSPPFAIGVQVPRDVCSAQLRQAPPHAWSQHTLSTQWLLAQSLVATHGWPFVFLPQLPLWQAIPVMQSLLLVQRLMQALFAQR